MSTKEETGKNIPNEEVLAETSFSFFVSTLALQASIFLGNIPSPVDNKKQKNLPQAKLIIDTMIMLRDKTRNNLDEEENDMLGKLLYELEMQYTKSVKEKTP